MTTLYLIVSLTVFNHLAYKGSKVLMALYAMELGASPMAVGVLFTLYSLFPLFLAVYVGRISDRVGVRIPMLVGSAGLSCGLVLPYLLPELGTMYAGAALIGALYVFYTVCVQHLIGAVKSGGDRARNFGIYSMGVSVTSMLGPAVTGFAIDGIGHQSTFMVLALAPLVAIVLMLTIGKRLPKVAVTGQGTQRKGTLELLGNAPLRRILMTAGITEAGGELFNLFLPIYGYSIGLSASAIGLIMGAYAMAMLVMRTVMPRLARRFGEEAVLCGSLAMAAATCLLFPFVDTVFLLAAAAVALGMGMGCCTPLSMLITYNRAPAGRAGEAMGMRQTVTKFTEVTVPLVFGGIGTLFGIGLAFWLNAVVLGTGAWIMRADARRRSAAARAAGDNWGEGRP